MSNPLEFALFGAPPRFSEPKPTGNLYRPNIERFLTYSRKFYENHCHTDEGELYRTLLN